MLLNVANNVLTLTVSAAHSISTIEELSPEILQHVKFTHNQNSQSPVAESSANVDIFSCKKCGFAKPSKQQVQFHILVCALGMKYFGCMQCDYQNYRREAVIQHVTAAHGEGETESLIMKHRDEILQFLNIPPEKLEPKMSGRPSLGISNGSTRKVS